MVLKGSGARPKIFLKGKLKSRGTMALLPWRVILNSSVQTADTGDCRVIVEGICVPSSQRLMVISGTARSILKEITSWINDPSISSHPRALIASFGTDSDNLISKAMGVFVADGDQHLSSVLSSSNANGCMTNRKVARLRFVALNTASKSSLNFAAARAQERLEP